MEIYKDEYDKIYPYVIEDAWGGVLHCTKEDLKELRKEINKILKEEKENEKG